VTVVPFPTAVLAQFLNHPDQKMAAVVYNATFIAIAILFNVLWRYAVSRHLLDKTVSATAAENISRQYCFGPLLYLVCLALAWINVRASIAGNISLALFFALPPSLLRKRSASRYPGS
jgi:uncharacterized membrane protein